MVAKTKSISRGAKSALASAISKKRPAAAMSTEDDEAWPEVAKKPAAAMADEELSEEAVLKRPSAATVLKKPAAAMADEEDEEDDEEAVLKRPSAATVLKKPAAAMADDEDEEGAKEKSEVQDARDAVKEVQRQQRFINKLNAENERYLEKVKSNKALLRKAEKELEASKEVAKKKTRKMGDKMRKAIRRKMEGKVSRAKDRTERIAEKIKAVKKRYNKMRASANKGKGRTADIELVYKRAQKSYEEAKKLCARLKKEGEDVPEEGFKDLSAPGAFKSPGIRAAKDRDVAKIQLTKAKAVWERAAAPTSAKEERLTALKEKIKQLQQEHEEAEEAIKLAKKGK